MRMNITICVAPMAATRTGIVAGGNIFSRCGWETLVLMGILFVGASTAHAQPSWQSLDIGTSTEGSTTDSGNTVSISGSGRDIWEAADGFRYFYREATGDFDLVTRVQSITYTDGWAKAAIMARSTLDPGSPHAMILVSADHGTAFQWRASANSSSQTSTPSEDGSAPRWLKLSRRGGEFGGFTSTDGITWAFAGRFSLTTADSILLGLAVTSHNDGVLCTADFEQLALTLAPIAPSNLHVVHRGPNGRIDLAWTDNSADETGFVIERAGTFQDATFAPIGTVGPNVTQFTAINPGEGAGYQFRVKAINGSVGAYSLRIFGTTTEPPSLSVWRTNVSSNSVTVEMRKFAHSISGPGGGPYSLERSTDNVNFAEIASGLQATQVNSTESRAIYTDNTVAPSTTYYYRARFLDTNGDASRYSTVSEQSTISTPPSEEPAAPSGLNATATSTTVVSLTWADNSNAETSFQLERSTDGANFSWLATLAPNATTYSDTGRTPGSTYYYRIKSIWDASPSPYSNVASVTMPTTSGSPPAAPTNLAATALSPTEIRLSWTDNATNETDYQKERSHDGVSFGIMFSGSGANQTSMTDSGLTASTTYYYRVRAVNSSGASAYSNIASATTPSGSSTDPAWTSTDIGTSTAGSTSGSGSAITLTGSGRDIWDSADGFRYYHRQTNAQDTDLTVQVASLSNTHGWAKAGVMFRETLDPSSAFVMMIVSADHGTALQYRAEPGGMAVTRTPTEDGSAPRWLRLSRRGAWFYGYTSWDGINWTGAGSIAFARFSSTSTLYAGLAVTSHNDGALCTATFDNFSFVPGGSAPDGTVPSIASVIAPSGTANSNAYSYGSQIIIPVNFTANVSVTGTPKIGLTIGGVARQADYFFGSGTSTLRFAYTVTASDHEALAIDGPIDLNGGTIKGADGSDARLTFTAPDTTQVVVNGTTPPAAPRLISVSPGTLSSDGSLVTLPVKGSGYYDVELSGTAPPGTRVILSVDGPPNQQAIPLGQAEADRNGAWTLTPPTFGMTPGSAYRRYLWASDAADNLSSVVTFMITTEGAESSPPAAPSDLTATATSSTEIELTWTDNANNETAFEIHSGALIARVGANSTRYLVTGLKPETSYTFVVVAINNAGVSQLTVASASTRPAPTNDWESSDIGLVGVAGKTVQNGDKFTVTGSGDDIWGTQDAFHFHSRSLTGDGEIHARVTALDNTNGWAKAGVMIRASADPGAPYVFIYVNPDFTVAWQHRDTPADNPSFAAVYGWPPIRLKINRIGNHFLLYYSFDEDGWHLADTVAVLMPSTVLAGLAVTSHERGTLANATFDQVVFRKWVDSGEPAPSAPAAPSNLSASIVSPGEIRLTWTDNSADETGFELDRSNNGVDFTRLETPAANATGYSDTRANTGHAYHYRIRATNTAGDSAYSVVFISTITTARTWFTSHIGKYGIGGAYTDDGSRIIIRGSGEDIWDTADGFYFMNQSLRGDGEIVARVQDMEDTHGWAKAGVMIRESVAPGSRHAFTFMTPSLGAYFHSRANTGATTTLTEGPWWASAPYWIKLTRRGDTFTSYTSADGTTWSLLTAQTITMPADVFIGLAVCAHDVTKFNTVTFTNVQISTP